MLQRFFTKATGAAFPEIEQQINKEVIKIAEPIIAKVPEVVRKVRQRAQSYFERISTETPKPAVQEPVVQVRPSQPSAPKVETPSVQAPPNQSIPIQTSIVRTPITTPQPEFPLMDMFYSRAMRSTGRARSNSSFYSPIQADTGDMYKKIIEAQRRKAERTFKELAKEKQHNPKPKTATETQPSSVQPTSQGKGKGNGSGSNQGPSSQLPLIAAAGTTAFFMCLLAEKFKQEDARAQHLLSNYDKLTKEELTELQTLFTSSGSYLPAFSKAVEFPETIKEISFEGGGYKGPAYVGALRALTEKGLLEAVTHVSGASVGAMTAFALSLGANVKTLETIMTEPNSFMVDLPETEAMARKLEEYAAHSGREQAEESVGNTGLLLIKAVSEIYAQGAISSGSKIRASLEANCEKLINEAEQRCKGVKALFKDPKAPTFAELANAADRFPESGLKKLTVSITEQGDPKPVIANAKTMPNTNVVEAVLASAALPFIFQSVKKDGKQLRDGGFTQNTGVTSGDNKPSETMVLAFQRPPIEPSALRVAKGKLSEGVLGGNFVLSHTAASIFAKGHHLGGHTVYVDPGSLTTLSSNAAPTEIQESIEKGYQSVSTQINAAQQIKETLGREAESSAVLSKPS